MTSLNHNLSRLFKEIASMYEYLGASEKFRALAYNKASLVLDGLKDDVSDYINKDAVEGVPGIGESISEKIIEFIRTGKIKKYDELRKKVPFEMMGLMSVSGFGPQSIKRIHEELDIDTKDELVEALKDGRVAKLKRFGEKKVENMLRGLKLQKESEERILLWKAMEIANRIIGEMKKNPDVKMIETAGSIRRRKETIGDIDIVICCAAKSRKKIIDKFISLKDVKTVLAKGDTKASVIIKDYNRQVDLRIINESEWGSALLYLTGSKEHNIQLRTIAKDKGYKINEYGVFRIKDDKYVAGKTEEEIYEMFGFSWIPPEMRENKGELELASKKKLPKLISIEDIKGDMQMHSTWSDGNMNIEELARFVLKNFNYEYIVLTDHSKSERVAGGMDEKKFLKQIGEIKKVNKKLGKDFIKCGVEVDILPDGSLDFKDDLLSKFDWVCASIHSGFKSDNTDRLISACRNKYVSCIGHPSGRLIGKREEYKVNWAKVFKEAAKTGTTMEINAQPDRMDLNDELVRQAREAGVMLTISTDSHSQNNFYFMELGVSVARRAWCKAADVLNTKKWSDVKKFASNKK